MVRHRRPGGRRVVVFNQRRASSRGQGIGSVATMRDRTELVSCNASSARTCRSPTPCARRPTSSPTSCTRSRGWCSWDCTTRWWPSSATSASGAATSATSWPAGWPTPRWPPGGGQVQCRDEAGSASSCPRSHTSPRWTWTPQPTWPRSREPGRQRLDACRDRRCHRLRLPRVLGRRGGRRGSRQRTRCSRPPGRGHLRAGLLHQAGGVRRAGHRATAGQPYLTRRGGLVAVQP